MLHVRTSRRFSWRYAALALAAGVSASGGLALGLSGGPADTSAPSHLLLERAQSPADAAVRIDPDFSHEKWVPSSIRVVLRGDRKVIVGKSDAGETCVRLEADDGAHQVCGVPEMDSATAGVLGGVAGRQGADGQMRYVLFGLVPDVFTKMSIGGAPARPVDDNVVVEPLSTEGALDVFFETADGERVKVPTFVGRERNP